MKLTTAVTEMLGIDHPIVCAPMATVTGGALAAAVSNAGGLGLIGGGYCSPDWIAREWQNAGNTPVGVGFITWALESAHLSTPSLLQESLAHSPKAVMLSFGDPALFAAEIKASGALLICQVQSVADARAAVAAGADIIVAQGTEAGGHGHTRSTFPLVPAVVDAVDVPVLAAGGIADGRGLAAALLLGAEGVLVGSRFAVSQESLFHANTKQKGIEGSGDDTLRSSVYDVARGIQWPEPWNIRTLRNPYLDKWHADQAGLAARGELERKRFLDAAIDGEMEVAGAVLGEGVDLIHDAPPAATILERMVTDAADRLVGAVERHIGV